MVTATPRPHEPSSSTCDLCLHREMTTKEVVYGSTKSGGTAPISVKCGGCGIDFPSKNKLFNHLRESLSCVPPEDAGIRDLLVPTDPRKWAYRFAVLYGYDLTEINPNDACKSLHDALVEGSIAQLSAKLPVKEGMPVPPLPVLDISAPKILRTYATLHRNTSILQQDLSGFVTSEILTFRSPVADVPTSNLPSNIRLLARPIPVPPNFNPERDATNRRAEYLVPLRFLSSDEGTLDAIISAAANLRRAEEVRWNGGQHPGGDISTPNVDSKILEIFHNVKSVMQSFTGEASKRKSLSASSSPRRKYHNFTPTGVAQEYFCSRRVDRFHHKGTFIHDGIPFISLSLNADMFLHEMPQRIVTAFIAIQMQLLPPILADFLLAEDFPSLTPVPPAPGFALIHGDNSYTNFEGKMKACLRPRASKCQYTEGWADESSFLSYQSYRTECFAAIAQKWIDEDLGSNWIESVLKPWCRDTQPKLAVYSKYVECGRSMIFMEKALTAMLPDINKSVPAIFEVTLEALRDIDRNGMWPGTTVGRRSVIVDPTKSFSEVIQERDKVRATKTKGGGKGKKASKKKLKVMSAISATAMSELAPKSSLRAEVQPKSGDGASGSFSIGYFPTEGGHSQMPASNKAFPRLVKAAFALERALLPDRPPSSTIAVNSRAQFRPHVDSGAGTGQSLSLIAGLGDYVGGEIVVENVISDIRYRAIEFNGWKQRHWTQPFVGERYSLVWFTPKGCENNRGIDLYLE